MFTFPKSTRAAAKPRRRQGRRPQVEELPRRELPTINFAGGVITIDGLTAPSHVRVDFIDWPDPDWDYYYVTVRDRATGSLREALQISVPGGVNPDDSIRSIRFDGSPGDDVFENNVSVESLA